MKKPTFSTINSSEGTYEIVNNLEYGRIDILNHRIDETFSISYSRLEEFIKVIKKIK